jgi:hypothetical protein
MRAPTIDQILRMYPSRRYPVRTLRKPVMIRLLSEDKEDKGEEDDGSRNYLVGDRPSNMKVMTTIELYKAHP